jgi:hypothetical protein
MHNVLATMMLGHDASLKALYKPQARPLQSSMKFPAGSPLNMHTYELTERSMEIMRGF